MDKIKQLKAKKLIKELNFIEYDYTYKNEMVNEIDTLFINSVNEFLDEHLELKEIFNDKINKKVEKAFNKKKKQIEEAEESIKNDETGELKSESIIEVKKPDDKIKKLYRKIVKITHPDKVKNKKLNEMYLKATKYYDLLDIAGIYSIIDELNIDFDVDDSEIELISNKINNLKDRICFIESTVTWNWYNIDDELTKKQIIINYIKNRLND